MKDASYGGKCRATCPKLTIDTAATDYLFNGKTHRHEDSAIKREMPPPASAPS